MTPHELCVGSPSAFFIEGQKFFIFGEGDLETPFKKMLLGNFDLITFDLPHFFEGFDVNLLEC